MAATVPPVSSAAWGAGSAARSLTMRAWAIPRPARPRGRAGRCGRRGPRAGPARRPPGRGPATSGRRPPPTRTPGPRCRSAAAGAGGRRQAAAASADHHPPGLAVQGTPQRGADAQRPVEEPGQEVAGQAEHRRRHPAGLGRGGDVVAAGQPDQLRRGDHVPGAAAARQRAVGDAGPGAPPVLDVGGHLPVLGPQPRAAFVLARRHHQVGEQHDLVGGQAQRAEHGDGGRRQPPRGQVGQRPPALGGEEQVAGGRADLAARAGADPVHRLDAVVHEGAGLGLDHPPALEGQDRHGLAAVPARCNWAAVRSSPVAGSTTSVSPATHFPIDGQAPTTTRVLGCRPDSNSSRST